MDGGIYIAVFYMLLRQQIAVGKLGWFSFEKGFYFYVGSAQWGLSGRLERHARKDKTLRWHIDYLSVKAEMLGAIVIDGQRRYECKIAREIGRMFELVVPGFGASDCRCDGHLFYTAKLP